MRPKAFLQLSILIVDDDDLVRKTLKLLLGVDRHLVEEASQANQALEMFEPGKFDLVITDYDMAGIKGDQLAAALKTLDPSQPVLMITARTDAVQDNPSLLKNIDGLVPKPFRMETLRQAIAHAIAKKRLPPSSLNS